jgi:SPASM domain peptide maturase of grasp-with-spasm system
MTNTYFRVFTSCFLVNGFSRSIICDVQRTDYQLIPNSLFEILTKFPDKSIEEIKFSYKNEFDETIDEYLDFLVQKEYFFYCEKDELELFPEIDLTWDNPSILTNAIVDIDKNSSHNFNEIVNQFELLGTKHFQLRCYDIKSISFFEGVLNELEERAILSVEFIIKASEETSLENLEILTGKFPRIHNLIVHSANENKVAKVDSTKIGNIIFTNQVIDNQSHCGIISPDYFSINIQTFTESQKHNTCLNRKISIDVNGEIKNCPSMTKSYGNIRDTTLIEAIEKPGFKDMWFIHKDQIEVCKDCEFRHICTDCRAYIQDPNNIYSKPAKCSYDPYTATWGEENPTNNPLHGQ